MAKTSPLPSLLLSLIFLSVVCSSFAASDSVYDVFLQCLRKQTNPQDDVSNTVFNQSNSSYTPILRAYIRNARFNTSSTPKPVIIVTPTQESHVQAAVICSKLVGYQIKIRSGGHDYDAISYVSDAPFFMLDMFNFRNIYVDVADESAWVGAGATLGEVYYRIWEKSKVHGFPAGVCPTVGVGGHLSGAGYGNMLRKFGLSVDNVVDAKIVDVNGVVRDRKSMGEDLFWAIRGGGGASFGVILGYKIKLVRVPETVTVFRAEKLMEENALDVTYRWQFVAPQTDPNLFMRLLLQPVTRNKKRTMRTTIIALYLGKADDLVSLLGKELPELGLKKENCTEMTWIQSVLWWANYDNATAISPDVLLDRNLDSANFLKRKSDYVEKEIKREDLDLLFRKMITIGKTGLVFNPYGGRMKEISPSDTPFPHRNKLFKIQYSVNWDDPGAELEKDFLNQIRTLYGFMTPYVSQNPRSSYLNYRDLDIGINNHNRNSYQEGEVYGRKYFGDNFDRLVKIKTAVDPQNFFWNEQSVPTLPTAAQSQVPSGVAGLPSRACRTLTGLVAYLLLLKEVEIIISKS